MAEARIGIESPYIVNDQSKVEELFHAALEQPPEKRAEFLRNACADNLELRGEVEALLDHASPNDSFLEGSPLSSTTNKSPVLVPGQRLGHFEILEFIGRGGMGEVYKARDTRLDRIVAIKRSNEQFIARFEREARAIAALNHPHICHLYDVGADYLVLEFIDGQPLKGPLPLNEALKYAQQICDALDTAHSNGVIHRDLKPANIVVTKAGVKVLDFGLAKMTRFHAANETVTEATQNGAIVGTLQYMSPEQLQGKPADARSDIFSFGVVLYEMLTGRQAFAGDSMAAVIGAILHTEPVYAGLPESVVRILRRCLAKQPADRWQSARDLKRELEWASLQITTGLGAAAPTASATVRRRSWMYPAIALAALGALLATGWMVFRSQRSTPGATNWQQITNFAGAVTDPALSPDGRMLTFIRGEHMFMTHGQVYLKLLPDGDPVELTHDRQTKMYPVFSPDGSRIAYSVGGWDTWVVPVLGGEPRLMLPNAEGLTWIDKQHILFSEIKHRPPMAVVTATEARAEERDIYVPSDAELGMAHFSHLSPDGKQVLIVEMDSNGWMPCRLAPFDGSSRGREVGPPASRCVAAAWSPDGKWMYFSAVVSDAFHLWRQRVDGSGLEQMTFGPTAQAGIAVEHDGKSLITSVGSAHLSVWIHDASGDRQASAEGRAAGPMFSPDWKTLYFSVEDAKSSNYELWATDVQAGRAERVLPGVLYRSARLTPDGKAIVYITSDGTILRAALDRGSGPKLLVSGAPVTGGVHITPSGRIYFLREANGAHFIYRMDADGSNSARVLEAPIRTFTVSPDERWIAAMFDEGKRNPPTVAYSLETHQKITICQGCAFAWMPDGKWARFAFRTLMGGEGFSAGVPLKKGSMLPPLPPDGIRGRADLMNMPGVEIVPFEQVAFGPDSTYAYVKATVEANLFRVPIP